MASERIKKVEIRDFGGIDRTASSNDTPVQKARVSRDGRRLPTGKFVRRPEYDFLYGYRNQQFEHTTDDDATPSLRKVRDDGTFDAGGTWGIPNTHEVYRSHGRKNICLGKSGTTEYTFLAYVEIHVSAQQHTLHIERGSRAATALDVTWPFADANNRCDVFSTPSHVGYANDWIEYSMVMNAAKDKIHLVITVHETDAPASTIVYHYNSTNDIYQANPASITWAVAATIESSTDITRDVDIEISTTGDSLYAIWGRAIAGDDVIRFASGSAAGVWVIGGSYTTLGRDFYGISLVLAPATTTLYMTYSYTELGARKLFYTRSTDGLVTFGAEVAVATDQLTGGTDFYYRGVFAVDSDGSRHWVYLDSGGTLTHTFTRSVFQAETYSSTVMTTAICLDATGVTNEVTTGWDFVVKNGCVSIFYVDDSTPRNTYKAVRIITSGDPEAGVYNQSDYVLESYKYDRIEVRATGIDVRYFGVYRKYERNSSLRVSWVSCATVTTTTNIRFLHSDKGLYEIDDTHSATNSIYADTNQVVIEALKESQITATNGTLTQILILQCDDNRLYKRVNYQWMLLEGSRKVDNSGWNWVTVFGDHARFLDYAGSVRMLAGDGATNQNAWYGYIDRFFFTNDASYRYIDNCSDLARPKTPQSVFTDILGSEVQAGFDHPTDTRHVPFTELIDAAAGVYQSHVTSPYFQLQDGSLAPWTELFGAITLEYDGVTESQLIVQTDNDPTIVGGSGLNQRPNHITGWLEFQLTINTWNGTSANRISPRVTAVNLYVGERQALADTKTSVKYYKVQRVQVSAQKPVGDNAFSASDYEGTSLWTTADSGATWTINAFVDYSMWANRDVSGSAESNLGTSLIRYQSTTSGTEIYTKMTTIPEGYKYGIVLQNEVWAGSVRLAGITRKNRLMRSARKLGNQVTPDGFTDMPGTYYDLPYEILGLSQVDDNNLVVMGKSGIDIFDITGGQLNKRDDITDIGTDATDSVFYLHEGAVGKLIKGVIFKDGIGNIRLFDGYGASIISDPIRDDFALTSDGVDANNYGVLTLNSTSLITTYVPLYRTLWLIYGSQVYVWDFAGGNDWQNWKLTHTITAVSQGVDGELFFTDGNTVYVWPQAGSIDSPSPLWRGADLPAPEDMRLIPKNVWCDYICAGTTLQPKVYKDRGAATNSTNTIAASSTQARARTGYLRSGSAARREIALGFGVTSASALTSLEVDSLVQELLIIPRRP